VDQYIVNHDGEQLGPYSVEELSALVADGTLAASDVVWREDWGETWHPLQTVLADGPPDSDPPLAEWEVIEKPAGGGFRQWRLVGVTTLRWTPKFGPPAKLKMWPISG